MADGKIAIRAAGRRQRGVVLITSMLLLLILTIFAISMFRNFGLQEKIAGNVREKQRALQNAESAQGYAESWLAGLTTTTPLELPCASFVTATSPAVVDVCTNAMAPSAILNVPWANGFRYNAPTGFVTASVTNNSVVQLPEFYIIDLGPFGFGEEFQVDAWSYAATTDTTAVVESAYLVKPAVACGNCYGGGGG